MALGRRARKSASGQLLLPRITSLSWLDAPPLMCLIAFGWNPSPQLRLLVVANRDEFHGRPSAPLAAWPEHPGLIAGRDLEAAGTWLGISTQGRFAAVTNVRLPGMASPGLRSRGQLPLDYLTATSAPQDHVQALEAALPQFGPCNLLLADRHHALHASNHPAVRTQVLQAGLYGLSNATLDTPWPKTTALKSAVRDWLARADVRDTRALFAALANAAPPPDALLPDTGIGLPRERFVAPAFIKGREYGTRCSTVVVVDHSGRGHITEHRFGPEGIPLGETRIDFEWPCD